MSDEKCCDSEITLGDDEDFISMSYQCQLAKGHEGPHKFTMESPEQKAVLTWEGA